MPTLPRTSLFRAPLLVVMLFVLALAALFPGAARPAHALAGLRAIPPDSTVIDGEVSDLLLKGKQLEVRYRNTGNVPTAILGEVQVRDAEGEVVEAVPFAESHKVAPGKRESFRVAMPLLPPGKYTLYAVVHFGGPALAAAQAELEVQP